MEALDLQRSHYDCGPTALHGALKLCGRKAKYDDLVRWAGSTEEKGTPAVGIKRALEKLKVPFTEYRSSNRMKAWRWARLQTQPAILCFDNDEHWVLLCAGTGRRVLVFDPEAGLRVYSRKDFMGRWVTGRNVYGILLGNRS